MIVSYLRPAWLTDSTTRPHLQVFLLQHFEVPLIEWTGVRPKVCCSSNNVLLNKFMQVVGEDRGTEGVN